ncbi:DUF4231 domain-containing protein [Pseudoalteromonas sp. L23]|uniref:DUF4231 domain-containing protein n=1 Tax=unclassified Pseudoalteromonas TaxID=194690 RepID=UPI001EF1412F|nr:DUF4231 domain-containing protein [Pseudoalteromonas sp. B530]MCF7515119.1 DUF4231 domain-containing protein [Pseudoalteromonas sp. L7]MCF7526957.1 DUF4231 domain-containing protein [Pseudoalteromonas sp. L23]MCX2767364.1 DUF4231 domain-containing protein [Pseudoalteromonas sp. B530]
MEKNTCGNARDYAMNQLQHFQEKASHNKFESLWCFKFIMLFTLSSPLLVSLAEGFWLSKVLPSILSALAAFLTAWLQLRKPQELWALYRGAERIIEMNLVKYDFSLGEYKNKSGDADQVLIETISQLKINTHESWKNNIPTKSELKLTQ